MVLVDAYMMWVLVEACMGWVHERNEREELFDVEDVAGWLTD